MCRKVELLDKRMMLGVVVTQIVPQMMQFQQLHQHQIEVDSLSSGNLSSIQPALRHLIDFITVQHQVGCESVMLVKKDVLVLNGQKLVQGMQVHKQLMLKIMSEGIAAHHLLCLFVQLAIDKDQLFAHLRDPAIVIRKDSITFNTACITGLEDVVYVHVMFNNDLKRIVVRGCDENDKDALRWCVAKPDKRKSRKMSCKPFATLVYQKMGWDSECRYKMLGYRITFEGETLYVFDLLVPEIFHEGQRKKNAVDSQDNAASTKPVNSRKGFYLDDIVGTFGVPVEEHRKESEVKQMDGYVSMGILTGKIAPEAGKD